LARGAFENGAPFALIITDVHMPEMDGFELARNIKKSPYCAGAVVLMLTSRDHPGDVRRARESGVSNFLLKPVRKTELRDVILRALDALNSSRQNSASPQPVPQSSDDSRPAISVRILLAKDNLVNQRFVQRVLEKRGYGVVVAGDGKEALEALRKETFDFVLMDIQMPEVDGFEVSRVIRESEKSSGLHVPIIALTAHATKDDQDRCVAAGMDGYLSKPVHSVDLLAMIEAFQLSTISSNPGSLIANNSAAPSVDHSLVGWSPQV